MRKEQPLKTRKGLLMKFTFNLEFSINEYEFESIWQDFLADWDGSNDFRMSDVIKYFAENTLLYAFFDDVSLEDFPANAFIPYLSQDAYDAIKLRAEAQIFEAIQEGYVIEYAHDYFRLKGDK